MVLLLVTVIPFTPFCHFVPKFGQRGLSSSREEPLLSFLFPCPCASEIKTSLSCCFQHLENGEMVKLQRNALHILEAPSGTWDFGDDNETEYDVGLPTSRSDGLSGMSDVRVFLVRKDGESKDSAVGATAFLTIGLWRRRSQAGRVSGLLSKRS
jgi:hypothetical protein